MRRGTRPGTCLEVAQTLEAQGALILGASGRLEGRCWRALGDGDAVRVLELWTGRESPEAHFRSGSLRV